MKIQQFLRFIVLLPIILILHPSAGLAQDFPDVCQQPENILRNCTFDSGLEHWQTFTETGSAGFSVLQGGGECHAPLCPAVYIVVDDHFVGGLYQQVPVTKGNNYYTNIVWLVFDSLANDAGIHNATGGIGRRIGIDPFGGTDPHSPNIVWAPDNWRNDCKICNIEQATVTAQAGTITVFLRIDDTWKLRAAEQGFPVPASTDKFWIDDIGLKQVGGDALPTAPPPSTGTPVPPPPTDTPIPEPAPNTPPPPDDTSPAETEPATTEVAATTQITVTETPVPESVLPTATPTPVPTNTLPPPPTLTPTATPSPTSTRPSPTRPRPRPATPKPEASELPFVLGAAGTTICMGGVVLLIVAVIMAGLVWLYRLGWGSVDEDDVDDELHPDPPPAVPDDAPVNEPVIEEDAAIDDE